MKTGHKIIAILLICLMCSACGNIKAEPQEDKEQQNQYNSDDNQAFLTPLAENTDPVIKGAIFSGTFYVKKDEKSYGYLAFLKNDKSGLFYNVNDDSATTFIYSHDSREVLFLFKDRTSFGGLIDQLDEETYIIKNDNETYEFSHINNDNAENFVYYSVDELFKLAAKYYEEKHSVKPEFYEINQTENNVIEMSLYESEDKEKFLAKYFLSRDSLIGMDGMLSKPIYLSDYIESKEE